MVYPTEINSEMSMELRMVNERGVEKEMRKVQLMEILTVEH